VEYGSQVVEIPPDFCIFKIRHCLHYIFQSMPTSFPSEIHTKVRTVMTFRQIMQNAKIFNFCSVVYETALVSLYCRFKTYKSSLLVISFMQLFCQNRCIRYINAYTHCAVISIAIQATPSTGIWLHFPIHLFLQNI